MLLGWGLFNVVEGLVDHHLLDIHHVHPGAGQLTWDVGFLVFGAAQIVAGLVSIGSTRQRREHPPVTASPAARQAGPR